MTRPYGTASYGVGTYQGGRLLDLGGYTLAESDAKALGRVDTSTVGKGLSASSAFLLLDVFSPLTAVGSSLTFAWAEARRNTTRALAPSLATTSAHTTSWADKSGAVYGLSSADAHVVAMLLWEAETVPAATDWATETTVSGNWYETTTQDATWV